MVTNGITTNYFLFREEATAFFIDSVKLII